MLISKKFKHSYSSLYSFGSFKSFRLQKPGVKCLIVTESNVAKLYLEKVFNHFTHFADTEFCIIDASENSKSIIVAMQIVEKAIAIGINKSDYIVGLGGGVISDVTGFVASILNRGTGLIQIPTTLLAMVDSTTGGKTSLNHSSSKNKIGTIYPANHIIIDQLFLSSLSDEIFKEGICEIIKIAFCLNKSLFDFVRIKADAINARDPKTLDKLIKMSVKTKINLVAKDLLDDNKRHILNFGHTIGHAIEKQSDYTIPHGIAVGMGMRLEMDFFEKMEFISKSLKNKLLTVLDLYNIPEYSGTVNMDYIAMDKKIISNNKISLPVPSKVGECNIKKINLEQIIDS